MTICPTSRSHNSSHNENDSPALMSHTILPDSAAKHNRSVPAKEGVAFVEISIYFSLQGTKLSGSQIGGGGSASRGPHLVLMAARLGETKQRASQRGADLSRCRCGPDRCGPPPPTERTVAQRNHREENLCLPIKTS